jgi:threonine dehydrogenase-like Zn-dependent dehydrogenase
VRLACCEPIPGVSGVYVGLLDKIPFGAAMNKGLTLKVGQTHVQRYTKLLLEKIEARVIDPSAIITTESRSKTRKKRI